MSTAHHPPAPEARAAGPWWRAVPSPWRARLRGCGLWLALCGPPLTAFDAPSGLRWWATAAAFPLLGIAVLLRRRLPLVSLALPAAASLVLTRDLFTVPYSLALAVFGYLAGVRMARARPALWSFTGLAVIGLPLSAVVDRTVWPWPTQLVTLLLFVVLPWLLGRYRRQYGTLVRTGWQLAERMEREQRAVADRTRLRERARIAGDMHDSLGHDLALIALRAAALEVDPRLDPERQEAAGELRKAAGAATERLREIVGVLRTGDESAVPASADDDVQALVERARASGMTVTLEHPDEDGEPAAEPAGRPDGARGTALAAMTDRAVRRVVQESLTNAAKHAPGAAVTVRIARSGGRLRVTVANARRPAGPVPEPVSGGSGLVGLDERVRLAGGELRAGPATDGGFLVSASLPAAGGAPSAPVGRPEPTTTERELAAVRRQVRRRLRQTVAVPLAVAAGLMVLLGVLHLVIPSWTALDRARYEGLRLGTPRSQMDAVLPFFALDAPPDGAPPPPRGWACVYYGVHPDSTAAYELCFADDRLVRRAVIHPRDP